MKTLGVKKKTFAGNMISRMYDYYFQGAINFRREYRKYYRKEFCSVEKFIEEHFNIKEGNRPNIGFEIIKNPPASCIACDAA